MSAACQASAHAEHWHLCPAPPDDPRPALYTRMGRLTEARTLVEQNLRADSPVRGPANSPPVSHRESTVLLAWICALLGDAEAARAYANQGSRLARALRAPIVEVAALARLGHAYLTGPDADLARARGVLSAITAPGGDDRRAAVSGRGATGPGDCGRHAGPARGGGGGRPRGAGDCRSRGRPLFHGHSVAGPRRRGGDGRRRAGRRVADNSARTERALHRCVCGLRGRYVEDAPVFAPPGMARL